ncbi:MAG: AAA family ATPase [Spirochaetes bacterium]|nr:AAA family ATPase [Spirochaetota bacterium]
MIPLKLSFSGIYSYREKQEIDFTKLTGAGIFGIFGHVGSGKSAILETITFALYGETERLNNRERGSNIMNLKSDSLSIEFIFKTSSGTYLTSVNVKREKNQFYKLKTPERRAFKKGGTDWEPIEYETIESIIGISYDNFKRTIIIPQGRFQEFLQLENSKRNLMMKELFHLEKYDLADKTGNLDKRNDAELENIEGRIKQLGDITPEKIESVKKELLKHQVELKEASNHQKILKEKKAELDSLKNLFEKEKKAKESFNALQNQKESFDKLEKTINDREYCIVNFKPALDALKSAQEKIKKYSEEIQAKETESNILSNELKDTNSVLQKAEKEYSEKETYKRKAEDFETIIELRKHQTDAEKLKERIDIGKSECLKLGNEIESKKAERAVLSDEIKKQRLSLPDIASLTNASNWFSNNDGYLNDLELIEKEHDAVKNHIAKLIIEKNDLFKNNNLPELINIEDFSKSSESIEQNISNAKKNLELITKELEELNTAKKISDYAANLHEGEACPLCGSKEHPSPAKPADISEHISAVKLKKDKLEEHKENLNSVLNELSKIHTLHKAKQEELLKTGNKKSNHQIKIDEHKKLFIWSDLSDKKSVMLKLKEAEKENKSIIEKEKCLENLVSEIDSLEKKEKSYIQRFEDIQSEYESKNSNCDKLKGRITLLDLNEYRAATDSDLTASKNDFIKKYENAESRYKEALHAREQLTGRIQTLAAEISTRSKDILHESAEIERTGKEIRTKLKDNRFSSIEEIENILSNKRDISDDKKALSMYLENFAVAKNELGLLNSQIDGRTYDENLHIQTNNEFDTNDSLIQSLNREIGKLETEEKKLSEDSMKIKEITARKNKLLLRKENIKTLKNLFKANGFVDYVSSVYLSNICQSANERFYRLTRQKLSLELTEDNSFIIRDFLNDGKTRSAKTLSGGQTFQAALSLSLALADDIHKISGAEENFFFLDEGFGSLDKESLNVVFDTLKALRKEKRIVGVISHVEDMQEEIDTYLRIENTEQKGSVIKTSWDE